MESEKLVKSNTREFNLNTENNLTLAHCNQHSQLKSQLYPQPQTQSKPPTTVQYLQFANGNPMLNASTTSNFNPLFVPCIPLSHYAHFIMVFPLPILKLLSLIEWCLVSMMYVWMVSWNWVSQLKGKVKVDFKKFILLLFCTKTLLMYCILLWPPLRAIHWEACMFCGAFYLLLREWYPPLKLHECQTF